MILKRRGVFLVEMLTVIFMVGIGGTLMAAGLASLLRSQDRVAAFGNQFTRINDFLRCIQADVRGATSSTLHEDEGAEPRLVLLLDKSSTQISYRFFEDHVERSGGEERQAKFWSPMKAVVSVVDSHEAGGNKGVAVTVFWRRMSPKDAEPSRRFDLLVRCTGGVEYEDH
jgi:hypothetical protein